jgi:hypothetical protein
MLFTSQLLPGFVVQVGMITFKPTETISEQLQELSRITQRPVGDLINDILEPALDQMIENQDADYMRLVLDGVFYDDVSQVKVAAENFNVLNRATVEENGQFHVRTAWAGDDNMVHFTEPALLRS